MNARERSGQSLIEIIVAIAIGVVLILGAITVIVPALRGGTSARDAQIAGALGKELAENVRVLSEYDWHIITGLATTSANTFYLDTGSSPFATSSGIENVSVATSTYQRYFYLDDVYRDSNGDIDTNGSKLDPSTKKLTVVYSWGTGSSNSIEEYLTRSGNRVVIQTDWIGGAGEEGPITSSSTTNSFSTSSNINFTTSTGAIVIDGF